MGAMVAAVTSAAGQMLPFGCHYFLGISSRNKNAFDRL
jgi:hypothetical protein